MIKRRVAAGSRNQDIRQGRESWEGHLDRKEKKKIRGNKYETKGK